MKKLSLISLSLITIIILTACGGQSETTPQISERDQNLATLAKVWGFTKYTHPVFLTGELCWDEELFNLIPIIYSADADDVNDILYEWFVGLGDDGFDEVSIVTVRGYVSRAVWERLTRTQWVSLVNSPFSDHFATVSIIALLDEENLTHLEAMQEELSWGGFHSLELLNESDINLFRMSDFSWINESYLGQPLFEQLASFQAIRPLDRMRAPVYFRDDIINSVFTNQLPHENMDFSDIQYRLLGLFRMWNAIEYYFPYRDILDRDWHELLLEYIPKMLEGDCRSSYELTLASLSRNLHDAHVVFTNTSYFMYRIMGGNYPLPAFLLEAEGYLVVSEPLFNDILLPGDAILGLNGKDIDEITSDMLQFLPYPNEEKALAYLSRFGLWSQYSDMTVTVLRGNGELQLQLDLNEIMLQAQLDGQGMNVTIIPSHQRLENNIGLINPAHLLHNEIHQVMQYFIDTDGLIVDLRQYPSDFIVHTLAEYLVEHRQVYAIFSNPIVTVPGVFLKEAQGYSGGLSSHGAYFYENPIVILMNESTMSQGEATVMSLRRGENVTVMGSNSIGANASTTTLPLPGGIDMSFTGIGIFTPEGGQTQRIGLFPDIRVDRTIQGIAEGRDELMEAAVEFLLR